MNELYSRVLVREQPKTDKKKQIDIQYQGCCVKPGVIVRELNDGGTSRIFDQTSSTVFVHIEILQESGKITGWISEHAIDAVYVSAEDASQPQLCEATTSRSCRIPQ